MIGDIKMSDQNSDFKSFLLGALIGGVVGTVTALLFAPKSGKELRRDIADTSADFYDKASDYVINVTNEGKSKVQEAYTVAKNKTSELIDEASEYKNSLQNRFTNLKEAAKAGADVFRTDLKTSSDENNIETEENIGF